MFSEQLKKILELAKKTGDRVIIYDGANPDISYVVMDIDSYINFQESEKKESKRVINEKEERDEKIVEKSRENEEEKDLTEEDLTDRINQEISMWKNQNKASDLSEEDKLKKSWQIPPAVKDKAKNIE
ncbi:MAG: hypothetical protein PHH52_02335 [Patescibacteria group bacterium]|nr:hypothetical protein [Patescibacteria group bacterium]MDD3778196.1 hypothetical protein [Patescibacteria group bacterium]MDD3939321.1 hypothetical protein [Patescibacteria group bacterium]MDD4443959.1 hypothetical protein [Patescibacteria group bacterium]